MDESLLKKIDEAKEHVAVKWDENRARSMERRLLSRTERHRPTVSWIRIGYAFAALAIVIGLGGAITTIVRRGDVAKDKGISDNATAARTMHLPDGSSIVLANDESSVRPLDSIPAGVGMEVVKGAARFDVKHDPARLFRVVAAGVTVEVIGTAFTVELYGGGARVAVDRGRVRVRWSDKTRLLSAGEAGVFGQVAPSADSPGDELPDEESPDGGATAVPSASASGKRGSPGEWRSLARDGDFSRAYEALRGEGPGAVRDEPQELLLQADVARLSGHPDQAVAPLRRLLARHATDAQAPLAAFTLGRVLLDELKRPRDAAQAFARTYRLGPTGPLAQDALAREVEAWSRAGEAGIARERAVRYVQSYPQGRKLNAVRHYGGLE